MKRVIITGATSGIGLEITRQLATKDCQIGIVARREEALRELQKAYPETIKATASIDVCDASASSKIADFIDTLGGIDLLIHAAGTGKTNTQLDLDTELATMDTNVQGLTRVVDTVFKYMAAHQGGHIAVITSIAGTKGLGAAPAYSATKAFGSTYLQALEQLANLRKLNIRFTDIRPGFVDTPLLSGTQYPMLMQPDAVARQIVRAIERQQHVAIIDWRWRITTALWRRIPRCIWRRLPIAPVKRREQAT